MFIAAPGDLPPSFEVRAPASLLTGAADRLWAPRLAVGPDGGPSAFGPPACANPERGRVQVPIPLRAGRCEGTVALSRSTLPARPADRCRGGPTPEFCGIPAARSSPVQGTPAAPYGRLGFTGMSPVFFAGLPCHHFGRTTSTAAAVRRDGSRSWPSAQDELTAMDLPSTPITRCRAWFRSALLRWPRDGLSPGFAIACDCAGRSASGRARSSSPCCLGSIRLHRPRSATFRRLHGCRLHWYLFAGD